MNKKKSIRTKKSKALVGAVIAGVVVVALVGGFFIYKKVTQKSENKTVYQYETVKKGSLTSTVSATGNVAVRDEVDVTPSASGKVKKVYVEEGDKVSKGDTLFTLTSTDVESQIKQAYSSVLSAKQQVAQAKSSLTSAESQLSAAKKGTASGGSVKSAKQAVTAAELGVSAANSQLSSAQSDYSDALDARSDLKVKAPCDGTVWTVSVSKGDSVTSQSSSSGSTSSSSGSSSSSSLSSASSSGSSTSSSSSSSAAMTIAKNSTLGVKVSVNESDINSIEEGQDVSVSLDAISGKTFKGSVDEISSTGTVSSSVVSYSVWVLLDDPTSAVKSGMTSSVDITTSKTDNVLLVSNAAVKGSGSNKYVLIMKSGATEPAQVKVTTGTRGSSQTIIKSGLTAGQKIVTQAITIDSSGDTSSVLGSMMSGQRGSKSSTNMPSGGMPSGGPSGGMPSGSTPGGN